MGAPPAIRFDGRDDPQITAVRRSCWTLHRITAARNFSFDL